MKTSRICSQCGNEYPLTKEYWHKHKSCKDGFRSPCKLCRAENAKPYYIENREQIAQRIKERRAADPERFRENCRRHYHKDIEKSRERGRDKHRRNRADNIRRARQWYRDNHEKALERQREYRQNNQDKVREGIRKWTENNPDKVKEKNERWNRNNPEKRKEISRNYLRRNPELFRLRSRHRRAKKKGAAGKHTNAEVSALFREQEGYCFHCGIDLIPIGFHRDHWIPLSRGGSDWIENIRLLCPKCNLSKNKKLPCEWDTRYCH